MKALVAVDLRTEPADVVARAVPWLDRLNAVADLVFVDSWREALERYVPFSARHELADMVAEDEATLAALLQTMPAARRGRAYVVPGLPGETIARLAADYDLVVTTTHGRTGLAHLWLGSVAERIARTSPVSVLVVRKPPPEGKARVLVGVALENGEAFPRLGSLARWVGPDARIDLLNVDEITHGELPAALPMVGPRTAEILLTESARHREMAVANLARLRDEQLPAEWRGAVAVAPGAAARVVVDHGTGYDLIVVGTHGRTGIARSLLGSVAERVVQRAPTSVLVLR